MPSSSAISPVCAAALAKLKADAAVTARVPAEKIGDFIQANTAAPYVLVESLGERPFNTLGMANTAKWGSTAGFRVRIVSQYRGISDIGDTFDAVKASLEGQPLDIDGFGTATVSFLFATVLPDALVGVPTRELVADFDVTVHQ